ncbi:App1 family protein [Nocardioides ochotonae]|uniref:App1 family protein n=1 Tax=Nocardioides ochotonae TaxID=2685869 RepID=UPI00140B503A|nr:phosphatase domain-containing protein [Nocardioides ochotonae]
MSDASRARALLATLERGWDHLRDRRRGEETPAHFRIVAYIGHGSAGRVILRGRVLDNPAPAETIEGEAVWAAVRRTAAGFLTRELPGVPLRLRIGAAETATATDRDGYFEAELEASDLVAPWTDARVSLAAPYRGIEAAGAVMQVRVAGPQVRLGIISDVDDTILQTGVQRTWSMVRQTLTGSALTRTPFAGAAELYRALEGPGNPFFYVSSSPWNLHDFLLDFLDHRGFPAGPLLLRDLVGDGRIGSRGHKLARIEEVLRLHPRLRFVLVGDSGEHDPEIYAEVVRRHPGRIAAVYIREVRMDPEDGRVEQVTDGWAHDVPFVVAADSAAVAHHAAGLGLLDASEVRAVEAAVRGGG